MPAKKAISFDDLGLDVALPSVLTTTKTERKKAQVEKRKEKKEREKEAIEVVAASREQIAKRKREIASEAAAMKAEKEQKRKMFRIENIKSRSQREEREKKEKEEALVSQQNVIAKMKQGWAIQEQEEKDVRELLEKERERLAKLQPQSVHIPIQRSTAIEEQRQGLPVLREEQPIVEAIHNTSRTCVLISGETGSGKTTQLPQFLWEAGYGHPEGACFGRDGCILVTEPRRVAAVSMARRVAEELNVEFGDEVCYHVRYDNNLSPNCKVKFATEGVILKEIQSDFLLKRYSVIIVDEAHERSISCDILIGLLSRIMPLRNDLYKEQLRNCEGDISRVTVKPLRLIIMSATLHIADFRDNRKLFPIPPPLIQVDARRYPVSNHFARKTVVKDYVNEAFKKVRQIHKKLPPGGLLVFLTTQQEIEDLCSQLRLHYQKNKIEYSADSYNKHSILVGEQAAACDAEESDEDEEANTEKDEFGLLDKDYTLENEEGGEEGSDDRDDLDEDSGAAESSTTPGGEEGVDLADNEVNGEYNTLHVLPLYALLDFKLQQEVFKDPPKGKRLCVVATNVAETSLTIPNIKYVVDSGRAKVKVMEEETKASCYRIDWISQASSEQRSGRAGRMGPGHCYRLYSTAVFANVMPKHTTPEILRTPLDTVVLLMKQVGIQHVHSFPFPSPPQESEIVDAMKHLRALGALDGTKGYRITPLGKRLVAFPVPPRFARALAEAFARKVPWRVAEMVCAIVATVSTVTSVFTGEGNRLKNLRSDSIKEDPQAQHIQSLLNRGSDLVTYLHCFASYYAHPEKCWYLCMVQKSMSEIRQLYYQIRSMMIKEREGTSGVRAEMDEVADAIDESECSLSPRPTESSCFSQDPLTVERSEELLIRRLFIPGLIDQVARRATVFECRSLGVEYTDKKTTKSPYLLLHSHCIAYVHPTSSISKTHPPPEYITFCFLQKVHRSEFKKAQTLMLGATIVTREWLDEYGMEEEVPER